MFKNAVLKATLRIIQWWIFSLFSLKIEISKIEVNFLL